MLGVFVFVFIIALFVLIIIYSPKKMLYGSLLDFKNNINFCLIMVSAAIGMGVITVYAFLPKFYKSFAKYGTVLNYKEFLTPDGYFIEFTFFNFLAVITIYFFIYSFWHNFILRKAAPCPKCDSLIYLYPDWKCKCGFINKKTLLFNKCNRCKVKLTSFICPNCKKSIPLEAAK